MSRDAGIEDVTKLAIVAVAAVIIAGSMVHFFRPQRPPTVYPHTQVSRDLGNGCVYEVISIDKNSDVSIVRCPHQDTTRLKHGKADRDITTESP